MYQLDFTDRHGEHFIRVDKAKARKAFNSGIKIGMLPWKQSPTWEGGSMYFIIGNKYMDFDTVVWEHEYYNCCAELGKYSAFYVSTEDPNA